MTNWSVVVTTAPRKEPTLEVCLDSLVDCGWTASEIHILGEPGSLPNSLGISMSLHEQKQGIWHNWLASVKHALATDAEYILTVQDDAEFHPDSKLFIEELDWPHPRAGFVSLYTPRHYSLMKKRRAGKRQRVEVLMPVGVRRIHTKSLWGACALVFPRKVLEHFVDTPLFRNWLGAAPKSRDPKVLERRKQNPSTIANSDTAIGKFMNWYNYTMWFVDPSPVAHIARYSTISHGGNTGNRNAYRVADRTIPLKEQVFGA